MTKTVTLGAVIWVVSISGLHAWFNLGLFEKKNRTGHTLKVGFLPVT